MVFGAVQLLLASAVSASATQICVLEPKQLRRCLEAAGALFAAFGPEDRIQGRLLWQGPGCEIPEGSERGAIHLVRRGSCSFSTKSAAAAKRGASAVVVVDFTSASGDGEAADTLVVGTQGGGGRVPLLLLGSRDAQPLVEAVEAGESVQIEVQVGKPARSIVMDVWLPPDAGTLLASLAPAAREMFGLRVRVHFRVVAAPEDASPALVARHCFAGLRELCAARVLQPWQTAPAAPWLHEAVYQHCLLRGFPQSYWWKYVETSNCSGSESCSRRMLSEIGLSTRDALAVQRCAASNAASFLEDDRESAPWGSAEEVALRINGWRYSGPLEAPRILRTICWQLEPSPACQRLLTKDSNSESGVLLWHLMGLCILAFAVGGIFKGPVTWSIRRLLRQLGHACKVA
ncbi:BP80 [Symbiodinium natans]|uniref:BP80 protein n=1 Tax=Symbiodinium natans TaxID=878477 RepID=A0A812INX6_9DINO|nr:BP80 [Symbiodinium natans]